jgi:oligoendopeptidase F
MSATADPLADPELLATEWDLSDLAQGPEEVERRLSEALALAREFAGRYQGQVSALDRPGLARAMRELAEIHELVGRAGSYASLRFATDTADPERGALLQRVQEQATAAETELLFFELEWAALDDERAEELLVADGPGADALDFARHHLRAARRYRPHLLSEPEEKILAEKAISSQSAWGRLFGELVSALQVSLDGEQVKLDVALSRLQSADREQRRSAAQAVSTALEPGLRTRAFIYNTLLHDKAVEDRLRRYPHWLAARNLDNEASEESVRALIEAVRRRYDIPQRWYRLKARLLGIECLADYDRAAPVRSEEVTVPFAQARDFVIATYASFSEEAGRLARRFFEERWVDAPVRANKRGGAFCSYTVPSAHPYVMLNFTARRRDVLTMAHELGHGLHAALARPQGVFQQGTPLTMAETASVFGEALTFGRMLDEVQDERQRLGLLGERIDGAIATVFRQMAMNRFEHLVHTRRRGEGELSVQRLCETWIETQAEMFGDSVQITDGYRLWWSYVPHFITTPGYVYAYAYGQLLALSAYGRYLEEGAAFVPRYLQLLGAGGSRSPEELGAIVGIDLADPGFWESGLSLVEAQLSEAERLAELSAPAPGACASAPPGARPR